MDLNRIKGLADAAAKGDAEMKDAIQEERGAKVQLLKALVEAVLPALPTICSKVPFGEAGRASEYGKEVRDWLEGTRAVLVGGSERPNPPLKKIEGVEPLQGRALYLSEDGRFFGLVFRGEFANTATQDRYEWQASDPVPISPEEIVAARWPVDHVVEAIADELEAAVEGKEKARAKASTAAERIWKGIDALAKMTRGVR